MTAATRSGLPPTDDNAALLADKAAPTESPTCHKCKKPLVNMGGGQWVCSFDPDKCREGE